MAPSRQRLQESSVHEERSILSWSDELEADENDALVRAFEAKDGKDWLCTILLGSSVRGLSALVARRRRLERIRSMENAHTHGPTQQRHSATSTTPGCHCLSHNDLRQSGFTYGLAVVRM
jgi:hypothetical protein